MFGKKIISIMAVGSGYPCKYARGRNRQDAIRGSQVGDPVSLREFTWKKEQAFAVMNDRIGADLGVVARADLLKVSRFCDSYDYAGVLSGISDDDDGRLYATAAFKGMRK